MNNFNPTNNSIINVRFEAVLRHVWNLRKEEISRILYVKLRTDLNSFLSALDTSHTWKDSLPIRKSEEDQLHICDVEYLDCSLQSLQDAQDKGEELQLLLSVRICPAIAVVIVRPLNSFTAAARYESITEYIAPTNVTPSEERE